jgi:putative hemolysin
MLDLIGIGLAVHGVWPPNALPETPIVIVANHPYGIADGIAVLALAEQLGRPFRVLTTTSCSRCRRSAPIPCGGQLGDAQRGCQVACVAIVIFPAGGVATAPKGFGYAKDPPWKMFPAKLAQSA